MLTPKERAALHKRVVHLYREQRLSSYRIAVKLGIHPSTASRIIKLHKLTRPWGWANGVHHSLDARDKTIARLYTRDKLTAEQIGVRLGLTKGCVKQILVRRGVPRRKPGDWVPGRPPRFYQTRAYAQLVAPRLGTGPGTSAASFAKAGGVNPATLLKHLRAIGVRSRIGNASTTRLWPDQVAAIKAQLLRGGKTQQRIADEYGVGLNTIGCIAMGQSWRHVPWPGGAKYKPTSKRAGRHFPTNAKATRTTRRKRR